MHHACVEHTYTGCLPYASWRRSGSTSARGSEGTCTLRNPYCKRCTLPSFFRAFPPRPHPPHPFLPLKNKKKSFSFSFESRSELRPVTERKKGFSFLDLVKYNDKFRISVQLQVQLTSLCTRVVSLGAWILQVMVWTLITWENLSRTFPWKIFHGHRKVQSYDGSFEVACAVEKIGEFERQPSSSVLLLLDTVRVYSVRLLRRYQFILLQTSHSPMTITVETLCAMFLNKPPKKNTNRPKNLGSWP